MDRKEHWEGIYTKNAPTRVSWYQRDPALSLRLIRDTGLGPDAQILDVGGGASTLVDRLCERGYSNLAVLDVSETALAHARQRLGDRAKAVQWFATDITRFEPPRSFDLWHDRAVFHFLTEPADRAAYVATLNRALDPGGHLIIMAFAVDGPKKCSGLDIVQYDVDKISAELGAGYELLATGFETHLTPSGNEQKFAYFHFRRTSDE